MLEPICIIDLSSTKILGGIVKDQQFHALEIDMPWEVGFRQQSDGTLLACFGEAFNRLDSNAPDEVRFPDLDLCFRDITDPKALHCLFTAFLEKIFGQRLPECRYPAQPMQLYVITPYQWQPIHRAQLRRTLKQDFPALTLSACLNQTLCTAIHYRSDWADLLATAETLDLFLVEFTRHDVILYRLACSQTSDHQSLDLRDIRQYRDYFMDRDKLISDLCASLSADSASSSVTVGFFGAITPANLPLIESLKARCPGTIAFEPRTDATLLGAAELARLFQTGQLVKPIHFTYQFCFGVRLPDGNWVKLIPKGLEPPCSRKRAFRITGHFQKCDLRLFCGLSLTESSDLHCLAELPIMLEGSDPMEFIVDVTLSEPTRGAFTLLRPQQREPISVAFTIPVLMD